MRKWLRFLLLLCCCLALGMSSVQAADRTPKQKDSKYYGAMRVVHCKEWVSLREGPRKTYNRIMKVPLDAIVMNCRYEKKGFVKCEYQGEEGYIMLKYLEPAPEYEPAETSAESRVMTREEILEGAEKVLDWKEFNVSVLASHQMSTADKIPKEILKVGCFIDDNPAWGYIESVDNKGDQTLLRVLIGGNIDEPQVLVYDAEYGLIMIDLLSGREKWVLPHAVCDLGDAGVTAVAEDGILYVVGSEAVTVTAISEDGRVLWQAIPDVKGTAAGITLDPDMIEVEYQTDSGRKIALLGYSGDVIDVH